MNTRLLCSVFVFCFSQSNFNSSRMYCVFLELEKIYPVRLFGVGLFAHSFFFSQFLCWWQGCRLRGIIAVLTYNVAFFEDGMKAVGIRSMKRVLVELH